MECKKLHKHLLEAIDGTLSGELRRALDAHLAQCSACSDSFEFARKAISSFRRIPQRDVPKEIWNRIAQQIAQGRVAPQRVFGWWQRFSEILTEISWGRRVAWSWALAAAVVMLAVWGLWDIRQGPTLQVVELAANPVTAFPSYFREHRNPAGQPISEGPMVLAFNTLGDRNH